MTSTGQDSAHAEVLAAEERRTRAMVDGAAGVNLHQPEAPGSVPSRSTQVLIAGGGPVGLSAAVELGLRGISCVVVEPRAQPTRTRPRAKTLNIRTMEHLRRWGFADRLRSVAPLPTWWSQDIAFCTSLLGTEITRFTGVLGLSDEGVSPELGQQAPQYVLEEMLREIVQEIPTCTALARWSLPPMAIRAGC